VQARTGLGQKRRDIGPSRPKKVPRGSLSFDRHKNFPHVALSLNHPPGVCTRGTVKAEWNNQEANGFRRPQGYEKVDLDSMHSRGFGGVVGYFLCLDCSSM
jgi:hypothetical protein